IELQSAPNPSTYGDAITLAANVFDDSGDALDGIVDFFDFTANVDLGTATVQNNVATLDIADLSAGSHVIVAHFLSADPTAFDDSESDPITQVVAPRDLHVTFTADGKVYDGNRVAVVHESDDRVAGDALDFGYAALFDTRDAGVNKT